MVVSDPFLETGRLTGGLDAPDQALVGQNPEGVVHRLTGDGADLGPDDLGDVARRAVGPTGYRPQHGGWPGALQGGSIAHDTPAS